MAINHGKLVFEKVIHDGMAVSIPYRESDHLRWNDGVHPTPGHWFIAVEADGTIVSAEEDPTASMITGRDIWEIEHAGPGEALRGKHWNGEEVVG